MRPVKLSVLVPAHDEMQTIGETLRRVIEVDLAALGVEKEIIVCDDGSRDSTAELADALAAVHPCLTVLRLSPNRGKGSAIRSGLRIASGDYILIQDADLEYDPADYHVLLRAALERDAAIVYGSRFLERRWPEGMRWPNWLINRLLCATSNLLYSSDISDEATCLKLFRTDILRSFDLECRRFEFCPEVTAKAGLRGIPIVEVPIRYCARTVLMGKKIRWTDGVAAFWTLLRLRKLHPLPSPRTNPNPPA
jgi:glycosyltransferase involved in cell wall biosynthesis